MIRLFVFCFFRILTFAFVISLLISFIASQIELLDSVERKVQNLFYVFVLAFASYFFDVFPLSFPLSSFRFFSALSEKIDYLQMFGLSKFKFIFSYSFLGFLMFFIVLVPIFSGYFSESLKEELKYVKGQTSREYVEYIEGKGIAFYKKDKNAKGRYEYTVLSEFGDILEKGYKNFQQKFNLLRYLVISFWLSLFSAVSSYIGIARVPAGVVLVLLLLGFSVIVFVR
ncbi:MAG: hypothetical protein NZ927_08150 [Candidatus Calescibacterium sp.]|nr:hypothetical protein [Candidatus Calescibacterium sp.]MDW8087696.1 hypothetical protein [Candidatus Calescibacterium sp.]